MKEFVKTLKQTLKVTGTNVGLCAGPAIFGSVLGIVIVLVIMHVDGTGEDYAHIGALVSLVITALMSFIGGLTTFPADFNMALSMGKARKYLIVANYIGWMINILVAVLIPLGTSVVEDLLYRSLYPGAVCEINMRAFLCAPIVVLTIVLCIPALVMLTGALMMKFGNKFVWVFWGGYIGCMAIASLIDKNPDSFVARLLFRFFEALSNLNVGPVVCIGISVICLVVAGLSLRKQRVIY